MIIKKAISKLVIFLLLVTLGACGGGSSSNTAPPENTVLPEASLVELEISPEISKLSIGDEIQLAAFAHYSDNSNAEFTNHVSWHSSDESIASVSPQGILKAHDSGQATIKIVQADIERQFLLNVSVNEEVVETVSLTALEISPANISLAAGSSVQPIVIGIYSDNSTRDLSKLVNWSSENEQFVIFTSSTENSVNLNGLEKGSSKITASYEEKQTSSNVTVTDAKLINIRIENFNSELPQNFQGTLKAIGLYSDGSEQDISHQIEWSSNNPEIFSIDISQTSFHALSHGKAVLQAKLDEVIVVREIQVLPITLQSIEITGPGDNSLIKNTNFNFVATGFYSDGSQKSITTQVNWLSSDSNALNVFNTPDSKGFAEAIQVANISIKASLQGVESSISVQVIDIPLTKIYITAPSREIALNDSLDLIATGTYGDGTQRNITEEVVWSNDDEQILTVSKVPGSKGSVYAHAIGATIINASLDGINSSLEITVVDKKLINIDIRFTGESTLAAGTSLQLTAIGNFDNGSQNNLSQQIDWQLSDNTLCRLSTDTAQYVTLEAINRGACGITARTNEISSSLTFQITDAVLTELQITPSNIQLAKGTSIQLVVTGKYSDNKTQDLTSQVNWATSENIVAINESGQLTALESGNSTITASFGTIEHNSLVVVNDVELEQIEIQLTSNQIILGVKQQLSAIGVFTDGSKQNISALVEWELTNPTLASIENNSDSDIHLIGTHPGVTQLSASLNEVTSSQEIELIDVPDAPTSIAMTASPYIILNNNSDASQIAINVGAASAEYTVADNTLVELEIVRGSASLSSQTLSTIDGKASVNITTDYKGIITLKASITETGVENYISIYGTENFSEALYRVGLFDGEVVDNEVSVGAKFGYILLNISNRVFQVLAYQIVNIETSTILATLSGTEIPNNNQLLFGDQFRTVYETKELMSNAFAAAYWVREPETESTFILTINFRLPANTN